MTDRVINESSKRITCGFNGYPGHKGVDLGWREDEDQNKVYANCKGVVETVVDGLDTMPVTSGSWGNYVLVKHPNGMYSRYCHLRKGTIKVKRGQTVDENTQLGVIGESGSVTARHLHFEVQKTVSSSTRIDPTPYLTKAIYVEEKKEETKNETVYTVVAGDTLIGIARKYNTTYQKLAEYNNISNPNLINVGQKIRIPNAFPVTTKKYVVQSGDTLSSIARKYGTSWQTLYNANKAVIGSNPDLIKPGQVLIIP